MNGPIPLAGPVSGVAGASALVTGGGRGIGRAIVDSLARAGAEVVAHYRSDGPHITELVKTTGALALQQDLLVEGGVESLIDLVRSQVGHIDILVNNAGILEATGTADTTDDSWGRTLYLNLEAPFSLTKALLPAMRQAGRGAIVNVASVAGVSGGAMGPAYAASKGGLIALTKFLARESAAKGVRVNAVAPTLTNTEMIQGADLAGTVQQILSGNPMGRLATPAEVAATVLYLCSDAAGYVNGQCLMVTGGP